MSTRMDKDQVLVKLRISFHSGRFVNVFAHYFFENLFFRQRDTIGIYSTYPESRRVVIQIICDIYFVISNIFFILLISLRRKRLNWLNLRLRLVLFLFVGVKFYQFFFLDFTVGVTITNDSHIL
jgi:hypothetical protein